eukprot:365253-Chlamydomonas_euryale.AAC.7
MAFVWDNVHTWVPGAHISSRTSLAMFKGQGTVAGRLGHITNARSVHPQTILPAVLCRPSAASNIQSP